MKVFNGLLALAIISSTLPAEARHLRDASGDLGAASGELAGASAELGLAIGNLGYQSIAFSGDLAITVGQPIADFVIDVAIETGHIFILAVDATGRTLEASGEAIQTGAYIAAEVTGDALREAHRRAELRAAQVKRIAVLTGKELDAAIRASTEAVASIPPRTVQALRMIGVSSATMVRDLSFASLKWSSQFADDQLYVVVNTGSELVVAPLDALNKVPAK